MSAVEVLNELNALHWSSDGNGATIPELVNALHIRGIAVDPSDVHHALQTAPVHLADELTITRNGHNVWTPSNGPL